MTTLGVGLFDDTDDRQCLMFTLKAASDTSNPIAFICRATGAGGRSRTLSLTGAENDKLGAAVAAANAVSAFVVRLIVVATVVNPF